MRKTLSVKPSDHIPDTEPYTLVTMTVETGTLLGYKVITMESAVEEKNYNKAFENIKPTLTDWSGTYINKDILTALSYCQTKLEYCEKIQLVRISAKKDLTIKVCKRYIDDVKPENDSSVKNPLESLKSCLKNKIGINPSKPILNAVGELGYAFLSYDAENTEIAFPHSLDHNDFLNIERIASFTTKEKYGVKEVRSINFNDGYTIKIPSGASLEKAVPKHSLIEGFPPGCY